MGNTSSQEDQNDLWKNKIISINKKDVPHFNFPKNSHFYFVESSTAKQKETQRQIILNAGFIQKQCDKTDNVELDFLDSSSIEVSPFPLSPFLPPFPSFLPPFSIFILIQNIMIKGDNEGGEVV